MDRGANHYRQDIEYIGPTQRGRKPLWFTGEGQNKRDASGTIYLVVFAVWTNYNPGMPRSARQTPGGYVFHALNRATARLALFRKAPGFAAFTRPAVASVMPAGAKPRAILLPSPP
jgi:hypothetical protein